MSYLFKLLKVAKTKISHYTQQYILLCIMTDLQDCHKITLLCSQDPRDQFEWFNSFWRHSWTSCAGNKARDLTSSSTLHEYTSANFFLETSN